MVHQRGRPTLRQVAEAAEVSTATVSNVINGTGRLSEATRTRVIAAARKLGYQPKNSVRALSRGGSGVLGLTLTTFESDSVSYTEIPYYSDLVLAAIGAANDHGYLLQVMPSTLSPWMWMTAPLDGVIHSEPKTTDSVRAILLQREIPIVYSGLPLDSGAGDAWVDCDHRLAVELLVERFIEAGARRIGLLLPEHNDAYPQLVLSAFTSACEDRGVDSCVADFELVPDYTTSERSAVNRLLTGPERPDALFGIYSDSGHNILAQVRQHCLHVPTDLLVGCFSEDPAYALTDPPITTLSLQPRKVAVEAVDLLVALIGGRRGIDRQRIVSPVLHARASSTGLA
jgi:DNA-binding LacI/PurR family transcriptional regulator